MDFNWLFHLGSQDIQHVLCDSSTKYFPLKTELMSCQGLTIMRTVSNNNPDACANACCANPTCALFQISSSGECSIGDVISIYNPFNWESTCTYNNKGYTFYSREQLVPDTDSSHFIASTKNYDDSNWRQLNLPHDFVVEGTFSFNASDAKHGYLPKNTSWYRKHFSLPITYKNDTTLWIDFDGIFRNSIIFINGVFLGNHSSGYTSFRYYIENDKHKLEFGDNSDNVLSIFVDATAAEGWWYEGGGIYRHIWLNKANKIYFKPWGVYLPTHVTKVYDNGIHGIGNLIINTTIVNNDDFVCVIDLKYEIIDPNGDVINNQYYSNISIDANNEFKFYPWLYNENVTLWDIDNPALYRINITMIANTNNEEIDFISLRYGYRKVIFDVEQGLFLNDRHVKIKGFCNHQDFAGTGIATPNRINRFRIQHLKNMGANAWRMSHNPPNPELLDFADEYGFLVWDENRHFGLSQQWMKDQRDMILRDRNHASIIMWSICNEAGCHEHGDPQLSNITKLFKEIIQSHDGIYNNSNQWGYNRPITAAMDNGWGDAMSPLLDIQGVNYNYKELIYYHYQYPKQSLISSESCSCTQDRNEYITSATKGHCSAYMGCPWNIDPCPQGCWIPIANHSYVIGSFDWTGFDYKGEPTPFRWPDINSHFGVNDIAGFPKDDYFYYKSVWTQIKDEIVLHILPNTWNGDTGTDPVAVRIYTNCKYVQVFLNNKSISNGTQKIEALEYYGIDIKYEVGILSVNCINENNNILKTKSLETTNKPYAIMLSQEYPYNNNGIIGDGQDVALINVFIIDNKNRIVPNATNMVHFTLQNNDNETAFILGVGNGDPASHEPDKANYRSVYHGKARVLIQTLLNKSGNITLIATSDGLKSDAIHIVIYNPQKSLFFV